jgi:methylmalonyl-CoA/ethylmalonyl-CoA epimerase
MPRLTSETTASPFLGLDHLVFLTRDIDGAISHWQQMLDLHTRVEHTEHGVAQAFFTLPDGAFIELVAPTDGESTVSQLIDEKGEGFYVLAMQVADMTSAQEQLKAQGATLVGEGTDRVFVRPASLAEPMVQLWPRDRPHRWRDGKTGGTST